MFQHRNDREALGQHNSFGRRKDRSYSCFPASEACREDRMHERIDDFSFGTGIDFSFRNVRHSAIYRHTITAHIVSRTIFDILRRGEASDSGLFHRLGKAACRKASRVRISPPPPSAFSIGFMLRPKLPSKQQVGLVVRSALRWSYLIVLLIPVAGYFLIIKYYTPPSFHVQFQLECENQGCRFKLDDQAMQKIESDLQNQLDQASRLDAFSKPLAGFIRYSPEATNKSTLIFSVSEPARRIPQNASVTCELPSFGIGIFSYDSGIVFENKTSLVDIPETVKSINGTLLSCVRGFQSESTDANFIIAPNATVSLQKPTIDFLIEFLPDRMSKILLALEVLVILLGLLPLIREGVKLLIRGWVYFEN